MDQALARLPLLLLRERVVPVRRRVEPLRRVLVLRDRVLLLLLRRLREDEELFRLGTFAPFSRASERPIAIACFRLVTRLPLRPLFSVPCLRLCIARLTDFFEASP